MRPSMAVILSIFPVFLITGCWNKFELTQWGFVQAVAIDPTEEGKIELTTHIYKPTGGGGEGGGPSPHEGIKFINVKTEAETIHDAIRDIPIQLGRKAKFDHMRVIIVGEELARKKNVAEILDIFSRDHEPRATVSIMIAKGKASEYLDVKPLIESTMGQQLRRIDETASRFSAKTIKTNLLDLALQLKSAGKVATVPYLDFGNTKPKTTPVAGIALLKKGKMVDLLSPTDAENLMILVNQYKSGVIEIPCEKQGKEDKKSMESFEVRSVQTKVTPRIKGNSLTVHVSAKIEGSTSELRCSSLLTKEQAKAFEEKIKKRVEQNLRKTIEFLQKEKVDAIGLGNKIYIKDPALWESWKEKWDQHFAASRFEIDVDVKVANTGMNVGKPFGK
ncbi:Ger(x)C family spore germination protein [Effusibacillus consociatus]|uniref:Ger(X)C family spore germination protein n=1 Tax=Effusibacillus consociatus TaxID=1117041 RepID=A0ABV9Q5X0_9BACL